MSLARKQIRSFDLRRPVRANKLNSDRLVFGPGRPEYGLSRHERHAVVSGAREELNSRAFLAVIRLKYQWRGLNCRLKL